MGKRLFEQPISADPLLTKRIAFGKAGAITENITLSAFVTWMQNKMSFLKASNNLSELSSTSATARGNIGAASISEVNSAIEGKANNSAVLRMGVNNPQPNYGTGLHEPISTSVCPLLRYGAIVDINSNPAVLTKLLGDLTCDITNQSGGTFVVNHRIAHSKYKVDVTMTGLDGEYFRGMTNKTNNSFQLTFNDAGICEFYIWDCSIMP